MELIENRGIHLGSLCTAHKEESLRIIQAVRSFLDQYEAVGVAAHRQFIQSSLINSSLLCLLMPQLYSWLMNTVDAFLKSHQDMRGTLPDARDVHQLHTQLLNEFNVTIILAWSSGPMSTWLTFPIRCYLMR